MRRVRDKEQMKQNLREQVLLYFAINRDEELSIGDICVKFRAPHRKSVVRALRESVDMGFLSRRWQADERTAVYSAGPVIKG